LYDHIHEFELSPELDELLLSFQGCEQPKVSIILPVFNHYRMTINCLRSISKHTTHLDYEVILADDGSSDLTTTISERVSGLVLCRSESNVGFLRNCNGGAEAARGEYLVFLNNDTAVTEGWLDHLIDELDRIPETGVVGPKLVYGDGQLQEAGGIIWRDGSGWNFGRLDDRDKPAYNYRKTVDYVSGACLVIRGRLWRELGGFDERYVPAYYEDTDLCFAVRELGYDVVYQPKSEVFHFEGVSNGTDLATGIKRYQEVNLGKFTQKWEQVLIRDHFENGDKVFLARDRSRHQRSILVIDHYVPSFDKDAGSRSTMMYLRHMVDMGYNVKFIGANFFPHQPYTQALQDLGIEVLHGEYMARHIDQWLQEHAQYFSAIYLHRPHVAEQFLPMLTRMEPRPKIIYFGHDLHYIRTSREAELYDSEELRRDAESWKKREYAVFGQVDQIYYPSQSEVEAIHAERPGLSVRAIPLYLVDDVEARHDDLSIREDMMFVGGFNHPPNVDGVQWLVREILPLVRERAPEIKLHIVGSNPPDAVLNLAADGVLVHGYVSDEVLFELYQSVKVAAVSLRYGAGVKGKVIEALQWGLPVVTTTVGAEGLPEAKDVMAVEDTPESFAEAVLMVLEDRPQALQKLEQCSGYLKDHFSKSRARDILIEDFGSPGL
jgi:GT2 family glycosyltransferase